MHSDRRSLDDGLTYLDWIRHRMKCLVEARQYGGWTPAEADEYQRLASIEIELIDDEAQAPPADLIVLD
jgi:hypothetical protein